MRSGEYWQTRAATAWSGTLEFANDWQWVFGLPPVIAAASTFLRGEGGVIINGHPAWDAFLVALAAFLVTAGGTYAWRFLFVAPYQMYQAVEQERDAAKIKLGHIEVTREKLTGLTDLRSIGISQFNEAPSTLGSLTAWHDKWRAWEQSVVAYLNDHFSPAEASLFHRLGKIPTHRFAQSEDAMHNHYLSCLSKELDILDKTVERHLPGSHVAR